MTKDQLLKFIRIRNSSEFDSNLQFGFDAKEAGFAVKELGDVERVGLKHDPAYRWQTPFGFLQEFRGKLSLHDPETGNQIYPGLIHVGMRE